MKKAKTKSARANLVLPVSRVTTIFKKLLPAQRLQATTPVTMTAILEYLTKEMLSAAGDVVRHDGRKRLTTAQLWKAIREDDDLNVLCGQIQGSGGAHFAATAAVATVAATAPVAATKMMPEPEPEPEPQEEEPEPEPQEEEEEEEEEGGKEEEEKE